MTLHVLIADKFTRPLYAHLINELRLEDQHWLYISDSETTVELPPNVYRLKQPLSRYMYCNLKLFVKLARKADRIVMHGDTLLHFFALYPFCLKKTGWIIYGQELYSLNKKENFRQKLKRFVLSKVKWHITHIEGDSQLANKLLGSKAQMVYSPMYMSNVTDTADFAPTDVSRKPKLKLMVGNSTDPSNNHEAIFNKILPYINDIETVYCPLSYGMYDHYKQEIAALGQQLFGEKFVVMDKFMPFVEYKEFLSNIDVVIFDHNRQEAMGVTLTLLSLGKTVYMNPKTTSYESLTNRGFRIFDNNLIEQEGLQTSKDVSDNVKRLQEYYSKAVFDASWSKINQL
jgi:dTDP-N-acetylfucosamine:lipid II N-acetylfucosaminyltransferase